MYISEEDSTNFILIFHLRITRVYGLNSWAKVEVALYIYIFVVLRNGIYMIDIFNYTYVDIIMTL